MGGDHSDQSRVSGGGRETAGVAVKTTASEAFVSFFFFCARFRFGFDALPFPTSALLLPSASWIAVPSKRRSGATSCSSTPRTRHGSTPRGGGWDCPSGGGLGLSGPGQSHLRAVSLCQHFADRVVVWPWQPHLGQNFWGVLGVLVDFELDFDFAPPPPTSVIPDRHPSSSLAALATCASALFFRLRRAVRMLASSVVAFVDLRSRTLVCSAKLRSAEPGNEHPSGRPKSFSHCRHRVTCQVGCVCPPASRWRSRNRSLI